MLSMVNNIYVRFKSEPNFLILILILLISSWHYRGVYDAYQWSTGLSILALVLIWSINSVSIILFLSYFVIGGIQIAKNADFFLRLPTLDHEPWPTFALGLYASISCMLIGGFSILKSKTYKDILPGALKHFTLINAWYVIIGAAFEFGRLTEGVGISGFIAYASLNGSLIVAGLPFVDKKPQQLFVCIMAVLLSKSSIPFGMLAIWAALEIISLNKIKLKTLAFSVTGGIVALTLGFFTVGNTLFDSANRFYFYRILLRQWRKDGLFFFGNGFGTFTSLAREVQIHDNFMVNKDSMHLLWNAHSDWLQILIEGGFFSIFCAGIFALFSMYNLYKLQMKPHLISLILIMSCMLFSSPLRYFPSALFAGLILFSWFNQSAELSKPA